MLEEWNGKLEQCRERLRTKEKLGDRIRLLEARMAELEEKAEHWKNHLALETADVEELTGMTFTAFWASLTGRKEERLAKERTEMLEAKLKLDQVLAAWKDAEQELSSVRIEWSFVRFAEGDLKAVLADKEAAILQLDPALATELNGLSERRSRATLELKEWREAYREGCSASQALMQAIRYLESAEGWGTWDLLGGGLLSTSMKHSRIDDCIAQLHNTQHRLMRFQEELRDVQLVYAAETLDLGGLLRFSDYFFDGFLVDLAVQGRIKDALAQLRDQMSRLAVMLQRLEEEVRRCEADAASLDREYRSLVEQAG
ncbi:hypothetical protein [Gorillibacterium sp. sgz5001074]|uniref:hypothetical protein n=1 Tax=Gorillibacterium sp. sgz5001074 TaxID=3446695 RepID=UPI003F66BF43